MKILDKVSFDELKEASEPLRELMNKKCCPYDIIVVQQDNVRLFSSEMGVAFDVKD